MYFNKFHTYRYILREREREREKERKRESETNIYIYMVWGSGPPPPGAFPPSLWNWMVVGWGGGVAGGGVSHLSSPLISVSLSLSLSLCLSVSLSPFPCLSPSLFSPNRDFSQGRGSYFAFFVIHCNPRIAGCQPTCLDVPRLA